MIEEEEAREEGGWRRRKAFSRVCNPFRAKIDGMDWLALSGLLTGGREAVLTRASSVGERGFAKTRGQEYALCGVGLAFVFSVAPLERGVPHLVSLFVFLSPRSPAVVAFRNAKSIEGRTG